MNPDQQVQDKGQLFVIFAVALIIFLGVNLVLSLALGSSFSPDDADQLIFSQTLERGYYEQPPLYSWLSYFFLQGLGLTRLSYYLLKTLSLGSIYVATFLCARALFGNRPSAILAAFSPLLIPTFGWHSFSYLTNSNLVCAATAATAYGLIRVERRGRWQDYLLLGLTIGLGLLSKYNFAFVAPAFFAAGLSIPSFRARLLHPRFLLTLAIAALLFLPNATWLLEHRMELTAILAQKLQLRHPGFFGGRGRGLWSLISNVFLILLPAAIILFLFRRPAIEGEARDGHHLLGRFFIFGAGLLLLLVVLGGATHFHERWLQPFLFLVPIYVLSFYRFDTARTRAFAIVLIVCATAYAAARATQVFVGGFDRGTYPLQMDFSPAVRQLEPIIPPGSVIIARDREIGGNLRFHFPGGRVLCSAQPLYFPSLDKFNGARILVWNTVNGNAPPPDLRAFVGQTLDLQVPENAPIHFVDVPPKLAGRRVNRLGYTVLSK